MVGGDVYCNISMGLLIVCQRGVGAKHRSGAFFGLHSLRMNLLEKPVTLGTRFRL